MSALDRALLDIEKMGHFQKANAARIQAFGEEARRMILAGHDKEHVRACYRQAVGHLYHEASLKPYWE